MYIVERKVNLHNYSKKNVAVCSKEYKVEYLPRTQIKIIHSETSALVSQET